MTGEELISTAIQFYDNTLATDAENANRRLRVLHYSNMVLDEIWNWRSWPFKFGTDVVSMVAGEGPLPSDFARFGTEGLVYKAPNQFWTEALLADVRVLQARGDRTERLFAVGGAAAGEMLFYGNMDCAPDSNQVTFTEHIPAGVRWDDQIVFTETLLVAMRVDDHNVLIQALPSDFYSGFAAINRGVVTPVLVIPDASVTELTVHYERTPPAVTDEAVSLPIPSSYHRTVLLAGLLARLQTAKNDVRIYWEKQYALGLGRMVVNEMPLASRMKQMPMAVGRNNC